MRRSAGCLLAAAAVAVILLIPLAGIPYATNLAFTLLVLFIIAQSWDWMGGLTGYFNLGHYAFYGIGAYAFAIILVGGSSTPIAFLAALFAGAVAAATLAYPLFRLQGDYFAFATLALLPLFELLAFNLSPITKGADGIMLPPKYVLVPAFYAAAALAITAFLTTIVITRSRFGYALKSIKNDEQAAEVVGVHTFPTKVGILAISAAFASLAGGIHAWQMSFIDPPTVFGLQVAFVPIAMALLGGSGLLWGPLVGALVLFVIQHWLLTNVTILHATIYGAIILLIGRYMPGGLLRSGAVQSVPFLRGLAKAYHHPEIQASRSDHQMSLPLATGHGANGRVLLECNDVTMRFGGLVALNNVSFDVKQGEIVGLVGANGSGKTTLFNCLSMMYRPSGSISFAGHELTTLRRDQVARLGIGRTFQIPRPFGDLTVAENIAIAGEFRAGATTLTDAFAQVDIFARFVGLEDRLASRADALTLQEKKSLELARALASRPSLLLVDEVASGLTLAEVRQFIRHIREIRDRYGVTVIWVEHIFSALSQVVDRLIVLEYGNIIADKPLAEAVVDERVLKSYLGVAGASVRR